MFFHQILTIWLYLTLDCETFLESGALRSDEIITVSSVMRTTAGSLEGAPAVKKYDCPTLQNKSTNAQSQGFITGKSNSSFQNFSIISMAFESYCRYLIKGRKIYA